MKLFQWAIMIFKIDMNISHVACEKSQDPYYHTLHVREYLDYRNINVEKESEQELIVRVRKNEPYFADRCR